MIIISHCSNRGLMKTFAPVDPMSADWRVLAEESHCGAGVEALW